MRRGGFQVWQLLPEDDILIFCIFLFAAGAGEAAFPRAASSPSPWERWDGAGMELKLLKLTAWVLPLEEQSWSFCCYLKNVTTRFFDARLPFPCSPAHLPAGEVLGQNTKHWEPVQHAELFISICMHANIISNFSPHLPATKRQNKASERL